MVLPESAADAGRAQAWASAPLHSIARLFARSEHGVIILMLGAVPTRLGEVVRFFSEAPPWSPEGGVMRVCLGAADLADVPEGSRMLLRIRVEEIPYLNVIRPYFAERRPRAVFWVDEATFRPLRSHAPDLFSFVFRIVEVPPRRWPEFAEQGVRAAIDAGVPFAWDGERAELEELLGEVGWEGNTVDLRTSMSFREQLRALEKPGLPVVEGIERPADSWRVRMALARAGREGAWVALRPSMVPAGMWRLHARQADVEDATTKLRAAGWEQAGAMAAWLDLEPERIEEAIGRVGQAPVDPAQWPAERVAMGDGPVHVLRARVGDADVASARTELRKGIAPMDEAGLVVWSEGAEPWRDEARGALEARLVRCLRCLGDGTPEPGSVDAAAAVGLADVAAELGRIRLERGTDERADRVVEWLTEYGEVELALRIADAWSDRARSAGDQEALYIAQTWLGDLHVALGNGELARRCYEEGSAVAQRLVARAPDYSDLECDLSMLHERLGDLYAALGDQDQARRHREESLSIARKLVRSTTLREASESAPSRARHLGSALSVFISYSHDSEAHARSVLALADRLRGDGLHVRLNQYVEKPAEGWPRWVTRQMAECRHVLIVCTPTLRKPTLRKRFEGQEGGEPVGGVRWEDWLDDMLYEAGARNEKLIPVLIGKANEQDVPRMLRAYARYRLPEEYEGLYRHLTAQAKTPAPPLGKMQVVPPTSRSGFESVKSQRSTNKPAIEETTDEVLIEELARTLWDDGHARLVLMRAGFPPSMVPAFRTPLVFWTMVVDAARNGAIVGGMRSLIDEAAKLFPNNPVFGSQRSVHDASEGGEWPAALENAPAQAQQYREEGLAIAKRQAVREPGRSDLRRDLYVSHERLGDLQASQGNGEQAQRHYEDGLTIARSLVEREPGRSDLQRDLAVLLIKLGDLALALGNAERAGRCYEEGSTIVRTLVEREPGRTDLQRDLAISYDRLGDLQRALGNGEQASQHYEDGVAIRRTLVERESERSDLQRDLAISLERLARMDPEKADLRREALMLLRDLHARGALEARYHPLLERLAETEG